MASSALPTMPACRKTHDGNSVRIKSIGICIIDQKRNGTVAILYLCRKNSLGRKAIIYGCQSVSLIHNFGHCLFHIADIGVLIVYQPSTTMHKDDQGYFILCAWGYINIQLVFL